MASRKVAIASSASPKVSLADRKHVSFSPDDNLSSVEDAQKVISEISSRKLVSKLTLRHNRLGDRGCVELFKFLCSPEGRKYHISEIDLRNNGIGDIGLDAISQYLSGNVVLRVIELNRNDFGRDQRVTSTFAEAVNQSCLETLTMSSNDLGDQIIPSFLEKLNSIYLQDLGLSMMSLTGASANHIASYLNSPRCHLHKLSLSGNSLGYHGCVSIIQALQKNYTLVELNLYAIGNAADGSSGVQGQANPMAEKTRCLNRNKTMKTIVEREALVLLRWSRALLFRSPRSDKSTDQPVSFHHLPIEIQLYILSHLAPTLSSAQRIRIFTYASDSSTLPRLLPTLWSSSSKCLPDPSGFPISAHMGDGCTNGRCMGAANSVNCQKETERSLWFSKVGCSAYEPDGGSYESVTN